ncbi:MAG: lipid-A-disaccharide synthase [Acidobacteriia bacterium]|nr:lipid-A-disaccharide synthase [Terriglobia bacterium]
MNFLLSAGEASGDTYGAQLAEALRHHAPAATFFGMGGEKMQTAGCDLLVHANEVAVVGLAEVVTHLPAIRRRFKHLVAEAARRKPDAAVLIDFPDFNLRLARELHRLGIPVFYFVSPQIWAWRTGRVKQIQKYVSKMIVIFPFEQEFYRRHGVEVSYVGHPLAYAAAPQISREEFAAKYQLDPLKQWIALLPGSRRKELALNIEPLFFAAEMLQDQGGDYQFVLPVASTLNKDWLAIKLHNLWASPIQVTLTEDARATMMHARASVVASGTATVEAALSGTPFVVVYRLSPLTWILGRRLVRLDTFAMPNLIAGRKIVTELIQKDFTAVNVVRELNAIIPEGPARQQMQAALKMVQERLHDGKDAEPPALRASREILRFLGNTSALSR